VHHYAHVFELLFSSPPWPHASPSQPTIALRQRDVAPAVWGIAAMGLMGALAFQTATLGVAVTPMLLAQRPAARADAAESANVTNQSTRAYRIRFVSRWRPF
jgi:hypothetical protein